MTEPTLELVWSSESEAVQFIGASATDESRKRSTRHRSRICTSLSAYTVSKLADKATQAFVLGTDLVEFRIDHLRSREIEKIGEHLSSFRDRSILTVRRSSEGGGFKGEEKERIALIKNLADLKPAYLDIELRTLESGGNLSTTDFGNNVIVSWHDQHKTPRRHLLISIMARAASYGGLVKIITTAKTASDNLSVLSLYDEPGPPPIAFCMGVPGIYSRVMAMERGSPMVYGSLPEEQIAPGQLSVVQLVALRRILENA